MKTLKLLFMAVVVTVSPLLKTEAQVFAATTYTFTVKGTSSLHDWESTVEKVDVKSHLVLQNNALSEIQDVVVEIPVKAIKSPKGKLMDTKTWEAFNYEKYPTIKFILTDEKIDPIKKTITATGALTMAGVTKSVDVHMTYKVLPEGDLRITGSHTLRMTDFKIAPPTAMMGTIKVGEEVVVTFEMILRPNRSL